MKSTTTNRNNYTESEVKTQWHASLLTLVWGLSIALSSFALTYLPVPKLLFGIVALLVNLSLGVVTVVAYVRWMKALDEMLRKIWIESMALTLGALWIAFGSLIILEKAEINTIDSVEAGLLAVLVGLGMALTAVRVRLYK